MITKQAEYKSVQIYRRVSAFTDLFATATQDRKAILLLATKESLCDPVIGMGERASVRISVYTKIGGIKWAQ